MGRDIYLSSTVSVLVDFNPRARVGRDAVAKDSGIPESISIHAPAWGATVALLFTETELGISIHAPAWGATKK